MIPALATIGHEYSVVSVDGSFEVINNAKLWCENTFGPAGDRWFYTFKRFYFRDEKDSLWFELRW